MRKINLILKRFFDFFASLIGIIIISPLLIITSFMIKIDSKGPIFFKQERLGKNGKVFKIIKFRTMIVNAENIGAGLSIENENDNRITSVGKFLRATSLDELPQLYNVLKGEMSLVGPRPPVVYHPYNGYIEYPNWTLDRFTMKPGITGLAQVRVRNSVSWDERIKFDIQYIIEFNVFLDLILIFNTIKNLIKPKNIYI